MIKHEIYVSREKTGLGHNNAAVLIKKTIDRALAAQGIDRATDVLSFPLNELVPGKFDPEMCERDMYSGAVMLGDMMISLERCEEQGEEFGHGFEREICYLTVHSVLHLLGYDHVDEGEMKEQMRKREKEIMGDKE